MTEDERKALELKKEVRKSAVRVWVTYMASAYVFGGGLLLAGLCIISIWVQALDNVALTVAKDFYLTVFPVATAVITFWFATRGASKNNSERD